MDCCFAWRDRAHATEPRGNDRFLPFPKDQRCRVRLDAKPSVGYSLGQVYIVGFTSYIDCAAQSLQNCFPTTPGAVIPGSNVVVDSNEGNGFVSVFNPSLSTLLYSPLLGDPNGESNRYGTEAFGVTVDPSGNSYVVGQTGSQLRIIGMSLHASTEVISEVHQNLVPRQR
jgi:hypothetical protein